MSDPWMPRDWYNAPDWAQWHTVNADGVAEYWQNCPLVEKWDDIDGEGNSFERETWNPPEGCEWQENWYWYPDMDGERVKGLDWRNSLRHRPQETAHE